MCCLIRSITGLCRRQISRKGKGCAAAKGEVIQIHPLNDRLLRSTARCTGTSLLWYSGSAAACQQCAAKQHCEELFFHALFLLTLHRTAGFVPAIFHWNPQYRTIHPVLPYHTSRPHSKCCHIPAGASFFPEWFQCPAGRLRDR